jgi:hypothetical protein
VVNKETPDVPGYPSEWTKSVDLQKALQTQTGNDVGVGRCWALGVVDVHDVLLCPSTWYDVFTMIHLGFFCDDVVSFKFRHRAVPWPS